MCPVLRTFLLPGEFKKGHDCAWVIHAHIGFMFMQLRCVMHAFLLYACMCICLHLAASVHVSLRMHVSFHGPDHFISLFIANPRLWPKIQTESSLSMGLLGGEEERRREGTREGE